MASFEITLTDQTIQHIHEAEAYQLEGPLTTFFTTDAGHGRLDSWATRLASFRSSDVVMIRRLDAMAGVRPDLELVVSADA